LIAAIKRQQLNENDIVIHKTHSLLSQSVQILLSTMSTLSLITCYL